MNSNGWAKTRRGALIERFGGKCSKCGSQESLEFHHTAPTRLSEIPRGRGRKERLCDVSRNPSCYAVLCRACHRGAHN